MARFDFFFFPQKKQQHSIGRAEPDVILTPSSPLSPSLPPVLFFLNLIFSAFHIYNLVTPSLPSPPAPSSPHHHQQRPPGPPTTHFCHQPVLTSNASLSVCLHPISGWCSLRNKDLPQPPPPTTPPTAWFLTPLPLPRPRHCLCLLLSIPGSSKSSLCLSSSHQR